MGRSARAQVPGQSGEDPAADAEPVLAAFVGGLLARGGEGRQEGDVGDDVVVRLHPGRERVVQVADEDLDPVAHPVDLRVEPGHSGRLGQQLHQRGPGPRCAATSPWKPGPEHRSRTRSPARQPVRRARATESRPK